MGKAIYDFRDKKVLIMGLGLLGGGVATAKWFVKQRAKVTVTDLKTRRQLVSSIEALGSAARKINFVLGRHRIQDFKNNDIIVVNPAVPRESKFLKVAREARKFITNDARIFFDTVQKNPIIAVTGTRGKTTVVNWITHFLKIKYPRVVASGNSSKTPLPSLIDKLHDNRTPAIVELSSWQLELLPGSRRAPDIAVITNIYPDHLNRYRSMKDYVLAKTNIFKGQDRSKTLILNKDDHWTQFFLKKRPRARVYFFSQKKLKPKINKRAVSRFSKRGTHNVQNLLVAILVANLQGISWQKIFSRIKSLPEIPYREEFIIKEKNLWVINDSASTSPEATIAALERFCNIGELVLIVGGTDKNLQYNPPTGGWTRAVKKYVKPENLFLLNGSATRKMVSALRGVGYFVKIKPQLFEELPALFKAAQRRLTLTSRGLTRKVSVGPRLPRVQSRGSVRVVPHFIILFSPGAASFEKFENEFDRGEKFNTYFRKLFGKKI